MTRTLPHWSTRLHRSARIIVLCRAGSCLVHGHGHVARGVLEQHHALPPEAALAVEILRLALEAQLPQAVEAVFVPAAVADIS